MKTTQNPYEIWFYFSLGKAVLEYYFFFTLRMMSFRSFHFYTYEKLPQYFTVAENYVQF